MLFPDSMVDEWLLALAALLLALGVIVKFASIMYRTVKNIEEAIGKDKGGYTVSERLERVEHQLFPNGGSSLVDKMNRIEADQHKMQGRMGSLETTLASLVRHLDRREIRDLGGV